MLRRILGGSSVLACTFSYACAWQIEISCILDFDLDLPCWVQMLQGNSERLIMGLYLPTSATVTQHMELPCLEPTKCAFQKCPEISYSSSDVGGERIRGLGYDPNLHTARDACLMSFDRIVSIDRAIVVRKSAVEDSTQYAHVDQISRKSLNQKQVALLCSARRRSRQ